MASIIPHLNSSKHWSPSCSPTIDRNGIILIFSKIVVAAKVLSQRKSCMYQENLKIGFACMMSLLRALPLFCISHSCSENRPTHFICQLINYKPSLAGHSALILPHLLQITFHEKTPKVFIIQPVSSCNRIDSRTILHHLSGYIGL